MAGAAGVSYGFADRFGTWLGFIVGGLFLLALDFRLPDWTPREPPPPQEP